MIEKRLRQCRRLHCGSVRIDETYVKICGKWRYLASIDSEEGAAVSAATRMLGRQTVKLDLL